MLRHLKAQPEIYNQLETRAAKLAAGAPAGWTVNRVGSMFTLFFSKDPVIDWTSASKSDTGRFAKYFRGMLERGIYLAPSQYEAAFVSAADSHADIERTIQACIEVVSD